MITWAGPTAWLWKKYDGELLALEGICIATWGFQKLCISRCPGAEQGGEEEWGGVQNIEQDAGAGSIMRGQCQVVNHADVKTMSICVSNKAA